MLTNPQLSQQSCQDEAVSQVPPVGLHSSVARCREQALAQLRQKVHSAGTLCVAGGGDMVAWSRPMIASVLLLPSASAKKMGKDVLTQET